MKINPKEQKVALKNLLVQIFGEELDEEKAFDWMKSFRDSMPQLSNVFDALVAYRGKHPSQGWNLKCDYVYKHGKLIIEYDERQHFSLARKVALDVYKDTIPLNFDAETWIDACVRIHARDNDPENRDETRAFYDSIRDIAAYQNGYRLVRLKYDDYDWTSADALEHLKKILE